MFISYAHTDEKWRVLLKPNFELLQREMLIKIWSDHQIVPGTKWNDEIKRRLDAAELYVFLMSTHLLTSDYVQKHELPAAMRRFQEGKAGLVPVILHPCSWKTYAGAFQGLPSGGKPVSAWRPYDNACFDVEQGLRKTIEEVRLMLTAADG